MICIVCHSHRLRRIRRAGFFRLEVAPLFGFYPWKCSNCGSTQMRKTRGMREHTLESDIPRMEAAHE